MTIPSFSAKGTSSFAIFNACTGAANMTPTYPAGVASGDLILLVFKGTCSAGSCDTLTMGRSYSSLNETGAGTQTYQGVWYRIADGTETGTETADLSFTTPTAGRGGCQFFLIKNNATVSLFDGTPVVTTGSAATSLSMPTLPSSGTTAAANELAVCIITLTSATTVTSSTGETGGDWIEAAAEDTGTNTTFDIQTANMTAAGSTISGGNAVAGVSTTFRNVGFLVKELAGATDDTIFPMMTRLNEGFAGYDDEAEAGYDISGFQASPTHDEGVNVIVANMIPFETVLWDADDEYWTPDWAQAPPTSLSDETRHNPGLSSNNDWIDEDEPFYEGWTQVVPTDQFDETGQTTGRVSNEDWVDEDEPIVQDWVYFQADETLAATDPDITGTSFADIYDDDEPVTDGWTWAQYDETLTATDDTITGQELGQPYDDDEPVADGWLGATPDQDDEYVRAPACAALLDCSGQFDDDEPVTDGSFSTPPDQDDEYTVPPQPDVWDDDEPVVEGWTQQVPTDQFDETGQTTGATSNSDWIDEDEPVADGWLSAAPDQDDEYVRPPTCSAGQNCDSLFEDEELVDGWLATPLEDAPVNDVGPQELGQLYDEDEPVTDGFLAGPLDDAAAAVDTTITGTSNNDWVDEDEPVTDGLAAGPADDLGIITVTGSLTMPLLTTSGISLYGAATLNKQRILPPRKHASLVSDKKKLPTDSLAMMQSVNDALTGKTNQRMVSGVMASVSEVNIGGLQVYIGSGVPQFAADPGSIYLNISGGGGSTMYVKESLSTSTVWVAK